MSILLKKVWLNGRIKDIYIEDNKIVAVEDKIRLNAEYKIDCLHKAAIPGLINGHGHAAMTLFRGYADDMPLDEWLNKKIWPHEAKLTEKDVYWGARLACLEMIKSGTTFFNDMYWHFHGTARAVEDSGIRAKVSSVFIDFNKDMLDEHIALNKKLFAESKKYSDRVQFALGPHALYTVSKESLLWQKEFAEKNNVQMHFHMSETKKEVDDCKKQHKMRPVEYLNKLGLLSKRLVACHSVWLNNKEIGLLAKNKVSVVHNPVSNMKLAVGGVFQYDNLKKAGINISLGTDGCASNNNLDMFEEMKVAAILQKFHNNNPTLLPANEVFSMATEGGAKVFNLNAGIIKEGKLADLVLVDLKNINLIPNHNLISNIVYSANRSCVDTTICNGQILMQNKKVEGEEQIIKKAQKVAMDFVNQK